jgi:hypothetical protein
MIEEIGEDSTKEILSCFVSKYNSDTENFLKNKAIEFSKKAVASTHIVFVNKNSEWLVAGYFALANKLFIAEPDSFMSESWKKRFLRFGEYYPELDRYIAPIPLIGQISRNYALGQGLISGDELLQLAMNIVRRAQRNLSGKMVYLESADHPKLIAFYERNGFVRMGHRPHECEDAEQGQLSSFVQYIRYL